MALSVDGRTCWTFGAGDHGKLGHGDTSRIYRPKVIEALQGMVLQKVQAGSQVSLALTTCGHVRFSNLRELQQYFLILLGRTFCSQILDVEKD